MKNILLIFTIIYNLQIHAELNSAQNPSLEAGAKCLQKQYGIYNEDDGKSQIYKKLECKDEVQVSNNGDIKNLNCPNDPVFEGFFTNGYSHKYQNNCLRAERNKNTNIYENVNCDCVRETIKADYPQSDQMKNDTFEKDLSQFKEELTAKANSRIGSKLVGKFQNLIKTDNLLSSMKDERHCFNKKFPKKLMNFISSKRCDGHRDKIKERLSKIFGKSLDLDLKNNDSNEQAIRKFTNALNGAHSKLFNDIAKNSCIKDPKLLEQSFSNSVNQPRFVQLDETFNDFLKNRDLSYKSPDSGDLKDDFYNYFKERNVQLHPILQTLAHRDLRGLLKGLASRRDSNMNLEDFLRSADGEWQKKTVESSQVMCAYAFGDMTNVLCPKADLAFDDPKLIQTIFTSTDAKENEELQEYKVKNTLKLKALYCKNHDIHKIDKDGKIFAIKKKFGDQTYSSVGTIRLNPGDFDKMIKGLRKTDPDKSFEKFNEMINDQLGVSKLPNGEVRKEEISDEVATHRKLGRINSFIDYFMIKREKFSKPESNSRGHQVHGRENNHRKRFMNKVLTLRESLIKKKENNVSELGKEIYKLGNNSNLSEEQFSNKFTKNYRDRNYTNAITEYAGHFDSPAGDKSKMPKCARNFSKIYCGVAAQMQSMQGINSSCTEKNLSSIAIDSLTKKHGKKMFHQNFCDIRTASENIVEDTISTLNDNLISMIGEPETCNDQDYLTYSAEVSESFDISKDSYYFNTHQNNPSDTFFDNIKSSTRDVSRSVNKEKSSIFGGLNIDSSRETLDNITSKLKNENLSPNSSLIPSNIFSNPKNSSSNPLAPQVQIQKSSNKESVEKSNQDLLDYIKQLERKLEAKEESLSKKTRNKAPSKELEDLKNEIQNLKEQTASVKKQYRDKVESNAKKSSKVKTLSPGPQGSSSSVFSNKLSNPASSQGSSQAIDEEVPTEQKTTQSGFSDQNIAPTNQSGPQTTTDSVNGLSLNEQFDEILSGPSPKKNVEINFNNETFELELAVSADGEMTCKFSDEKLNETNKEDLDQICKGYIESMNKKTLLPEVKKTETPSKEAPAATEEKQRNQKFKVQDLNQVLGN